MLALEHLHAQRIAYRDLKPENILIQESGHIMLVDFDLSAKLPAKISSFSPPNPTRTKKPGPVKKSRRLFPCFSFNSGVSPEISGPTRNSSISSETSGKSNSFVGTEEYVAPEIIKGDGHDYAVDWWSLGIVLYEMLYGRTPFRGQNRKETFYRILNMNVNLVGEKTALRDLIGRLLEKEAEKRIGVEEIKRHEFFRGVNWEEVLAVERTPFIPVGVDWEEGESLDVERCVEDVFGGGEGKKGEGEDVVRNLPQNEDFSVF